MRMKSGLSSRLWLIWVLWFGGLLPVCGVEPVVVFDATPLFSLDLRDEVQRRRFWDESQLLAALEGLVNRSGPRLFVRYLREPDDFWWGEMTRSGGWLSGRPVERVETLGALIERFRGVIRGAVVWDERVPATSNLASTIAGCDDLLPLRADSNPESLMRRLTESGLRLSVVVRLMDPSGGPMFTGKGQVPGTSIPSTGSGKCDAYVWLIEHYVKTGRADPRYLGYYLDAWWLRSWNRSGPENHTLSNHDYVIAHRGVLFDLGVWEDEMPVDDPGQPQGADVATLKRLLRSGWEAMHGDGVIHAAGFVPWAFKYTSFRSAEGSAGGHHAEVPTEWRYAEILSCFNAYMDADALGLGAMANASFYQHYPLAARYPQPWKPDRAALIQRGWLDAQGRIPRKSFVAHYVGDYDAASWLYRKLPGMWGDPARGRVPLAWAFNPNLAERFPLGMAWARLGATTNDTFVAGDSGAGYLNPGYLTPPRPHSGLASGLEAWERHCRAFYERWDLSVTGFMIDGNARPLSPEGWVAYARFSPGGIVAQKVPAQGVRSGMPFLRMATDLSPDVGVAVREIVGMCGGVRPRFVVCRSILQSPGWYAAVSEQLRMSHGDSIEVVDLPSLLWMVREYEAHRADYVDRRYANAKSISATPAIEAGLRPVEVADGRVEVSGVGEDGRWTFGGVKRSRYLYFAADEVFNRGAVPRLSVEVTFRAVGGGRLMLEYDSADAHAPVAGAYKAHLEIVDCQVGEGWRTWTWSVADARFGGSQNGQCDFRLVMVGGGVEVRKVVVHRMER